MATKIRLARAGSKKRPFYRIVAADVRAPRDGRFIEKLGTYNPLLPKNDGERVVLVKERIQYWLDKGAQPTDRVLRFLDAAGMAKREARNNPKKAVPRPKTLEKAEERKAKLEAKKEADAAAKEAAKAEAEAPKALKKLLSKTLVPWTLVPRLLLLTHQQRHPAAGRRGAS